jgi:hypothetical protein
MNKVHTTIRRWVQQIAGKNQHQTEARTSQRPAELGAQALRHVGGGTESAQTPNKGW